MLFNHNISLILYREPRDQAPLTNSVAFKGTSFLFTVN